MESLGYMRSKTPDLVIYTEASPTVGHGHLTRCVALAEEASRRGLNAAFSVSDSYTAHIVEASGQIVLDNVPAFTPFIIRDFRDGSSVIDVKRYRDAGSRVLLLDELGEARTCATIVSDALMTPERSRFFAHAADVAYLYGLEYAPLRRRFMEVASTRVEAGAARRLFISFGGCDPLGITLRFLQALDDYNFGGPTTVVAGGTPREFNEALKITSAWKETTVHQGVEDMAELMKGGCLVATKIGITLMESFCLGMGCVFIEPSPAHVALEAKLAQYYSPWPAVEYGLAEEVDFFYAARETMKMLEDASLLNDLGRSAAHLVDGCGILRLIDALTGDS